jgi:exodeoxyribonuclease-3
MRVRIATFNVNGVNGRLPVLLRWLAEAEPDIVCLQELKAPQGKFPAAALRDAGYEAAWLGQPRWNGVAILSRVGAIHPTQSGLPDEPDPAQSRYVEAAVNGVIIASLYVPNGNPRPGARFDYKMAWLDALIARAQFLIDSDAPVVLAGDFNVMPTPRDVYRPERWVDDALFTPEVRAAFSRLTAQGWTDALRHLYPDDTLYTFWDYLRDAYARDAGLRIDHLLLSPALTPRLSAAGVNRHVRGWPHASDHAPTWIALDDD